MSASVYHCFDGFCVSFGVFALYIGAVVLLDSGTFLLLYAI